MVAAKVAICALGERMGALQYVPASPDGNSTSSRLEPNTCKLQENSKFAVQAKAQQQQQQQQQQQGAAYSTSS